jgi:hypothetical protein
MRTRYAFKHLFLPFAFYITSIDSIHAEWWETIGGGTISSPAAGPPPAFGIGGSGFSLVKNWHFGTNGTIKNISNLNANFQYHDQFGTTHNPNYGAVIVAPDAADALRGQPVEGAITAGAPVRAFFADSMQTYLVPLNGATTLVPTALEADHFRPNGRCPQAARSSVTTSFGKRASVMSRRPIFILGFGPAETRGITAPRWT